MGKDKSGTWFRGCHQVPREEVSDDSRGNACLCSMKKSHVSCGGFCLVLVVIGDIRWANFGVCL